jgi:ABC-2 type transport system permease protein
VTKLLKTEWIKLKNYNAFIVLSLFFVVGIVVANYIVYYTKTQVIDKADTMGLVAGSIYNFPGTWQTTSYVSGCLLLLSGLLIALLTTNEFSYRTHRQNIIDGWSRQNFIHVKLMLCLIAAAAATVVVFLTALVFGSIGSTAFSLQGIKFIGFFFLKALSYNLIALLFSVLIRKTGFAIGLFFVYMWLENFLSVLLQGWSYKLKADGKLDIGDMGDYLPMNAADALLSFPENTLTKMAKNAAPLPHDYWQVTLGLAILYMLVYIAWSKNRIEKTDL